MIGFISSAKTLIALISSLLLLLVDIELCLGQAPPQRTIDICPARNLIVLSFEELRINLLQNSSSTGQNCSVHLPIQERSWINVGTRGYNVEHSESSESCVPARQDYYVEVSHPDTSPRYYCGSSKRYEAIFSSYSNEASQLSLLLVAKPPPYNGINSYYQLVYTVARVVFQGKNGNTVERVKQKDKIVSHSDYAYVDGQMYPSDVDSTLTLAGLSLGSTVRLRIRDFDVDKADRACNDYLRIEGLNYEMRSQIKICYRTIGFYDTTAISTNMSFNFVSDESNNQGTGFHIEYEITEEGCRPNAIEYADIEYNSTTSGFVAVCKGGYWFEGTESGDKNITCNLTDSTWSNTTPCSDINECLISKEGCSDVCSNTEGSYLCTCTDSSASLLPDGLTCSGSKDKQSKATGASTTTYIAVGVAVPVAMIILIVLIIVLIRRKRRNTESSKPGVTHSISMKEVNVSDKEAITPQDTALPMYAEAKKPPNATRTKGYGVVADENSMYQNNQQLSGHHQPMPTQQREALDLVDNDLYGT